ncbi:hypothetical protein PHET_02652, partial [Paragonimus heterotremus]
MSLQFHCTYILMSVFNCVCLYFFEAACASTGQVEEFMCCCLVFVLSCTAAALFQYMFPSLSVFASNL